MLHSRNASDEDRTHWSPRMGRDRQPGGRCDIQAHWIEDSLGRLRYRDRVRNRRQATRDLRCRRSHTPSGGCGQLDGRLQQRGGRRLEERRLQDEKLRKEEAQASDERVRLMQRQRRRISRARWPNQGAALPTLKVDRAIEGLDVALGVLLRACWRIIGRFGAWPDPDGERMFLASVAGTRPRTRADVRAESALAGADRPQRARPSAR